MGGWEGEEIVHAQVALDLQVTGGCGLHRWSGMCACLAILASLVWTSRYKTRGWRRIMSSKIIVQDRFGRVWPPEPILAGPAA